MDERVNKLIHAYVTDGKGCWHERLDNTQRYRVPSPCVCGKQYTSKKNLKHHIETANPDYFTRKHFPDLKDKLFGDKRMYEAFYFSTVTKYFSETGKIMNPITTVDFTAFLFLDYTRFCILFCDFLRLPETIEEFGWEECCEETCIGGVVMHENGKDVKCIECNGTGRIPKSWAVLAKET